MKKILAVFILLLIITAPVKAVSQILINEVLIEPAPQSVELINISSETADISGWYLDDSGGSTYFTIPQSTIMFPNSCVIFSGDFNFNKSSSDSVRLFDNTANPISTETKLIDYFTYKSSPGVSISYQRIPDADQWATKSASLGLFNSNGQSCLVTPTLTTTPEPTMTPIIIMSPTPNPTSKISYDNIFISEVMVYPDSNESEWVEIFNANDFTVNLEDWYIDDTADAGSTPKKFSVTIEANSYQTVELNTNIFNNDADQVRLLDFDKDQKDGFEYSETKKSMTLGRVDFNSDYFCIQNPSFGFKNNPCYETENITPTKKSSIGKTEPTLKNTQINTLILNNSKKTYSYPTQKPNNQESNPGDILGINSVVVPNKHRSIIKLLTFLSLCYSLLTIAMVLFKMNLIYEKTIGFFSSFIYSSSTK